MKIPEHYRIGGGKCEICQNLLINKTSGKEEFVLQEVTIFSKDNLPKRKSSKRIQTEKVRRLESSIIVQHDQTYIMSRLQVLLLIVGWLLV